MPIRDRLLALTVAMLWGVNFLAIDVGLRHFPPLLFAALRFAVIAVPTVLFVPRPAVQARWVLGYGLGFGTAQFGLLFTAIHVGMPAGLASLVLQASAPFTVLLGVLVLRERPSGIQLAGITLAIGGMAVILLHRAEVAAALPVVLTLAGALGWALGNLCSRQALSPTSHSRPEGRPGQDDPMRLTLWMSVVPPVPLAALSVTFEGPRAGLHAVSTLDTPTGWAALAALAYIVVPATVMASGIWTTLMRRHPAGMVAPFSLLVPVVGMSTSRLVLDERYALVELAAAVVIITGVLLGSHRPSRSTRPGPDLSTHDTAKERARAD
ncbi:EamA family transporter [Actinopolyspora saharensis]|uniref:EamA family transporter n=1 Tax=Actinopolyspora saharensis TaxID=995062 RepID=UPI003F6738A7